MALAAFLPVYFAPVYRAMEIRKIQEKKRQRAHAIQAKMQRERVNALRGSIGLSHLKKLGLTTGTRRMKFREPFLRQAVTENWRRNSSESPESNSPSA